MIKIVEGINEMTRVQDFYQDLQRKELNDYQISCGLGNGDIEKPEWLAVSESDDHLIMWDNEEGDRTHWSAIRVEYTAG